MCDEQLESYDPDSHSIQEPYDEFYGDWPVEISPPEWQPSHRNIPQSTFPGEQPRTIAGQLTLMDEVITREIEDYFA